MKVADVSGFYSPAGGGVRTYVDQKFEAARRLGHDLTVIAPGATNRVDSRPGGRVVWVEGPPMPFDPAYRRFPRPAAVWRILDALAPDMVEGSSPWRSGVIAGRWPGRAARAFVFHQDFVAGYPQTLLDGFLAPEAVDRLFAPYWARLRRLSLAFDVTVASGAWLAQRLAGFGVHRPVAVPFGVEAGRFSPALRDPVLRAEVLARCATPSTGRLLLSVGRLHPEKRQRVIIDGFVRARARGGEPIGLAIVGDGPDRAGIEALARRAGAIWLAGAIKDRDQLARLFASADLLLHGSSAETYGLVVAEAMASGLPVVAPSAGGAGELARRGPARLYPAGDPEALAEAILHMLRTAQARSAAPIPTAEEHFERLFDLYQDLLDARASMGQAA